MTEIQRRKIAASELAAKIREVRQRIAVAELDAKLERLRAELEAVQAHEAELAAERGEASRVAFDAE